MYNKLKEILTSDPRRAKNSFWFSDSEKNNFDLYHDFLGTEYTNPPELETRMMWEVGKQVEEAWVKKMREAGFVMTEEETAEVGELKDGQLYLKGTKLGAPVSGKPDALLSATGEPLEIKTYYDKFKFLGKDGKFAGYHERELLNNKPSPQYCKQLAIQMDFLDKEAGYLLFIDRGTGSFYTFKQTRVGNLFSCGDTAFDISDTYKKWSNLYQDHVLPKIEPVSEYRYKIPVQEVNWRKVSKSDRTKARAGTKIIGDGWQVAYSSYKNLIIEREGSSLGYSLSELDLIKQFTDKHTTWK